MLGSAILLVIVGCEAAFWLLLGAGLTARYVFQRARLSLVLLYLVA